MEQITTKTYQEQLIELELSIKKIVVQQGSKLNLLEVIGTLENLKNDDKRDNIKILTTSRAVNVLHNSLSLILNKAPYISEIEKIGILMMMQLDISRGAFGE